MATASQKMRLIASLLEREDVVPRASPESDQLPATRSGNRPPETVGETDREAVEEGFEGGGGRSVEHGPIDQPPGRPERRVVPALEAQHRLAAGRPHFETADEGGEEPRLIGRFPPQGKPAGAVVLLESRAEPDSRGAIETNAGEAHLEGHEQPLWAF